MGCVDVKKERSPLAHTHKFQTSGGRLNPALLQAAELEPLLLLLPFQGTLAPLHPADASQHPNRQGTLNTEVPAQHGPQAPSAPAQLCCTERQILQPTKYSLTLCSPTGCLMMCAWVVGQKLEQTVCTIPAALLNL